MVEAKTTLLIVCNPPFQVMQSPLQNIIPAEDQPPTETHFHQAQPDSPKKDIQRDTIPTLNCPHEKETQ